jgi:hypothetical protein
MNYLRRYAQQNAFAPGLVQNTNSPGQPLQQALGGAKPRTPAMGMPMMPSSKPMQTVDWRPPGYMGSPMTPQAPNYGGGKTNPGGPVVDWRPPGWRQPAGPQRQPRYGGMGGTVSNTPGIRWKAY